MKPGFAVDHAHYNVTQQGQWVVGEPKPGFFGLKLSGSKVFPLRGLRCERCGFVELYARRMPFGV